MTRRSKSPWGFGSLELITWTYPPGHITGQLSER